MVKDLFKTKNDRFNSSTTPKKRINVQQTQRNSVFNSTNKGLKRSNSRQQQQPVTTGKRTMLPGKLPTIRQKTPSTASVHQPIPTAYIRESPGSQKITVTVITEPPSLKFFQPRLPPIKDHVIKENLTQKATLRCKSPRRGSLYSRSNTGIVPEPEEPPRSRHPLQRMDVGSLLSESARKRLKHLFNKLDTDQDGHLLYTQVQRCLPPNLPRAQLTFIHVLYDIISDATFFGLQEFYTTAIIVEVIAKQDSTLWNIYLDDVDFNYYHENIVQLIEEFNNQCVGDTGTMSYESLLQLIIKRTTNDKTEGITNQLEYVMPKIKTMKINRLDFLALLPVIIYIESCFNGGGVLFRFRDNSILDVDIHRALLT